MKMHLDLAALYSRRVSVVVRAGEDETPLFTTSRRDIPCRADEAVFASLYASAFAEARQWVLARLDIAAFSLRREGPLTGVVMKYGPVEYTLACVRTLAICLRAIEQLRADHHQVRGCIGLAFDYMRSTANTLVLHEDPSVYGLYVPTDKMFSVRDFFGR